MKKIVQILSLLFVVTTTVHSQHFIGLHSEAIQEIMNEQHSDFNQDNSFVNKSFNYLKYIDNLEQRTWLFFLDENDYCRSSKLVCDYVLLDEIMEELNKTYKKSGDLSWYYKQDDNTFSVTVKKEEWFFSILTKPKEEK
jgi:hypothetical protein